MTTDDGRAPSGQALVASDGAATHLHPSGFDPSRWRTDEPPFDKRPMRQFIVVDGWREHSGVLWRRRYADTAYIRRDDQPDSILGYRREDMERIMRDGDMDGIEAVVGWKPIGGISYSASGDPNASAIEARRAATENAGAVHESAVGAAETPEPTPPTQEGPR